MYFISLSLILINKESVQCGMGVLILLETPTDYTNTYSLYKERRSKEGKAEGKMGRWVEMSFSLQSLSIWKVI